MENKPNYHFYIEEGINKQIAYHERMIRELKITLKMFKDNPPPKIDVIQLNAPLTKDLIRTFMRNIKKQVRTIEVIEMLYPNVQDEQKSKLIKTLSVIFNILEKEGEVSIEKERGIKGNYYKWIKK